MVPDLTGNNAACCSKRNRALELPSGGFTGVGKYPLIVPVAGGYGGSAGDPAVADSLCGGVGAGRVMPLPKQALPESVGLNPDVILNLFLPILIF